MRPGVRVIALVVGLCAGITVVALILTLIDGIAGRPRGGGADPDVAVEVPAPAWAPASPAPVAAAVPGAGVSGLVDPRWVTVVAAQTGIPETALAAYAGATLSVRGTRPQCALPWNLLAAIGRVESDHGRHGGSSLDAGGTAVPPIYGVPLEGGATLRIPDSDGGAYDGDASVDRAMGPMQLIPQTWQSWHNDASGDGVEDPQNIQDAALAAASYLCRSASAVDTEAGWVDAVTAYNPAPSYRDKVAKAGVEYLAAAALALR